MKVAFQGIRGAYSEAAAHKILGEKINAVGIDDSSDVVNHVLTGKADLGILPIENSIVGVVDINLDLFVHRPIKAIGEVYLQIDHCLYGLKGSKLSDIKFALSHPIALGQCKDFLTTQQIQTLPYYDTAGSCKEILDRKNTTIAAIAGPNILKHFDLELLASNIQSVKNNFTRFIVFENDQHELKLPHENQVTLKTSLTFKLVHKPSALLNCLQVFADQKLNLTKIQSRPNPQNPFSYFFYIDFIGDTESVQVKECLSRLKEHCESLKVIGCYPQGNFIIS
jgi:prephenate dehydratase